MTIPEFMDISINVGIIPSQYSVLTGTVHGFQLDVWICPYSGVQWGPVCSPSLLYCHEKYVAFVRLYLAVNLQSVHFPQAKLL